MLPLSDAASRIKGQEMFQILATARELERKGKPVEIVDFKTPKQVWDVINLFS